MTASIKSFLKKLLPAPAYRLMWCLIHVKDIFASAGFIFNRNLGISLCQRISLVSSFYKASICIESPHTQREILHMVKTILTLPRDRQGAVVEAGCFKGSSTAKFSLAAKLAGRELIVFDSFAGIPDNNELHDTNIYGKDAYFGRGDYCGPIDEVKANVEKYGAIECCTFIKGWFDDTMPGFDRRLAAVYIDVDLASSTRTCIRYLYPLLAPGGMFYSQDGHLPLVIDVFDNDDFWKNSVGCSKPAVRGLGTHKLLQICKE